MATEMGDREHGRERRKRATRRALRAAALRLGLERGLDDVSVEEIAALAGVSTRTFFNHFAAKDDAVLLDLFTVPAADLAAFAAVAGGDPWLDLMRLFGDDIERAGPDAADLPRYLELHARHPAVQGRQLARFARFEADLADAIAARLGDQPDARLRADTMAGSCITAVRVALRHWGLTGWQGSARTHVEAAFRVLSPAFFTAP